MREFAKLFAESKWYEQAMLVGAVASAAIGTLVTVGAMLVGIVFGAHVIFGL